MQNGPKRLISRKNSHFSNYWLSDNSLSHHAIIARACKKLCKIVHFVQNKTKVKMAPDFTLEARREKLKTFLLWRPGEDQVLSLPKVAWKVGLVSTESQLSAAWVIGQPITDEQKDFRQRAREFSNLSDFFDLPFHSVIEIL